MEEEENSNQNWYTFTVKVSVSDPFQTIRIRIRVGPKTYQNHEKNVLKNTICTKKKFRNVTKNSIFCYISDYIVNIVYMKKTLQNI